MGEGYDNFQVKMITCRPAATPSFIHPWTVEITIDYHSHPMRSREFLDRP